MSYGNRDVGQLLAEDSRGSWCGGSVTLIRIHINIQPTKLDLEVQEFGELVRVVNL